MRARKYNKRIEIWQLGSEEEINEFGTPIYEEILLTSSWCKLITPSKDYRRTDYGLTETTDTIIIELRKRNDITYNSVNQFFKYRNERYVLQSEPINVGFEDREIQITLKKEVNNIVTEIPPITKGFPLQFPFKLK